MRENPDLPLFIDGEKLDGLEVYGPASRSQPDEPSGMDADAVWCGVACAGARPGDTILIVARPCVNRHPQRDVSPLRFAPAQVSAPPAPPQMPSALHLPRLFHAQIHDTDCTT